MLEVAFGPIGLAFAAVAVAVAAPDILGDQDFSESRLADSRGTEHEGMTHPLGVVHPHILFFELNGMDRRLPANGGQWRERIPPRPCLE